MSNYRRAHVPVGTFFFTVKTERNAPIFRRNDAVRILGDVIRETKRLWSFEINAIVLLPDYSSHDLVSSTGRCRLLETMGMVKKRIYKTVFERRGTGTENIALSKKESKARRLATAILWAHD